MDRDLMMIISMMLTLIAVLVVVWGILSFYTSLYYSQTIKNIGCAELSYNCSCSQLSQWWNYENLANSEKTLAIMTQKGCVIQ
jgi:type II secretory pathway component PulC